MSQLRFAVCLVASLALHLVLGLLLYFDVMGPGGGFGIGSGPGVGIGQGGGLGLGKGKKRQIFALEDAAAKPAPPKRGRIEDRLAAVVAPNAPVKSRIALAGDLPVALPKQAALPPVAAAAPRSDVAATGSAGAVVIGGLGGAGGGGGFGISLGNFGRYVTELRAKGLDVVFVVDGTASMGDVIALVRRDLAGLVASIQGLVPIARIGFVIYRDRNDEIPVEIVPLTASRKKLDGFLKSVRAEGGGDWPESLNLGLEAALEKMSWRPDAKRLLVFVAQLTAARRRARGDGRHGAAHPRRGRCRERGRPVARDARGVHACLRARELRPRRHGGGARPHAGVLRRGARGVP